MIRTKEMVPETYYNRSRDFQFLGRVYDVVFNYLNTEIDSTRSVALNKNINRSLLDLIVTTLGFESKHNYTNNQLYAICSIFMQVIRNKGTLSSVQLALNTLLQVEGVTEAGGVTVDSDKLNINVFIPSKLTDINLFKDLLNYILPAGVSYLIRRQGLNEITPNTPFTTASALASNTVTKGKMYSTTSELSSLAKVYDGTVKSAYAGADGSLNTEDILDNPMGRIDNAIVVPFDESNETGK